jgi:hypothetical protein
LIDVSLDRAICQGGTPFRSGSRGVESEVAYDYGYAKSS